MSFADFSLHLTSSIDGGMVAEPEVCTRGEYFAQARTAPDEIGQRVSIEGREETLALFGRFLRSFVY
jgi:hypothetical protein